MVEISFEEWQKMDFRVGEILEVDDHPNADKLWVIKVDVGEADPRTLVAGLKEHYEKDDLIGKKVVVFMNLKPVELRGVKSGGMVLAAVEDGKVVLIGPEQDINNGAKIS